MHGNKIRATKDEIQQDSKINKQKSYFHNSRSKSCSFMKLHATSEISLVHPTTAKQVVTSLQALAKGVVVRRICKVEVSRERGASEWKRKCSSKSSTS